MVQGKAITLIAIFGFIALAKSAPLIPAVPGQVPEVPVQPPNLAGLLGQLLELLQGLPLGAVKSALSVRDQPASLANILPSVPDLPVPVQLPNIAGITQLLELLAQLLQTLQRLLGNAPLVSGLPLGALTSALPVGDQPADLPVPVPVQLPNIAGITQLLKLLAQVLQTLQRLLGNAPLVPGLPLAAVTSAVPFANVLPAGDQPADVSAVVETLKNLVQGLPGLGAATSALPVQVPQVEPESVLAAVATLKNFAQALPVANVLPARDQPAKKE